MKNKERIEATQNTFGLKIGYKIQGDLLTLWLTRGKNVCSVVVEKNEFWRGRNWHKIESRKWHKYNQVIIERFEIIKGVMAFTYTKKPQNVTYWFRAKGFKEFLEEGWLWKGNMEPPK